MKLGLIEGKQTRITPIVKREARKIKGKDLNYVSNILKYLKKNYNFPKRIPDKIHRRIRTAEEIIQSKIMSGCTDYATLCIALLRAKKMPSIYIETFKKEWVEKPSNKLIQGHIFVKTKIGKEWTLLDPTRGTINVTNNYGNYKPMKEGIDFLTMFPTRENYIKEINKHFKLKLK